MADHPRTQPSLEPAPHYHFGRSPAARLPLSVEELGDGDPEILGQTMGTTVQAAPIAAEGPPDPTGTGLLHELYALRRRVAELEVSQQRAERTIMHLAFHDALTGLPNRMLFNDRVSLAVTQAARNRSRLGVMLLDLDRFREINDRYGHTVGDELLRRIGHRIQRRLRSGDTVARTGGDEFMLLLPELTKPQDIHTIAVDVMDAVRESIQLAGKTLRVTAAIGTAVYPEDGADAEELMRHADRGMSRAKQAAPGRHCHFQEAASQR